MSDTMFATKEAQQAVKELPFVTEVGRGSIDFWTGVEASGDADADVALGEQCADMALYLARKFQMPLLIAMCLRDMILAGRFTAVEAGFVASIASAASVWSNH
jgi:hypothetical protein